MAAEAATVEAEAAVKATAEAESKAAADAETAKVAEAAKADEAEKAEWDYDRGMATITKLRDEVKAAKAAAKERDELAAKLKTIEDAQLSEHDKLAKRVEEYEARETAWAAEKKETALKLGVFSLQATLGVADTDLALAALDRSQVEYDDAGQPTNLQDVLTALLEAKPLLKGVTVPPASGSLNAGAGAQSGPPLQLSAEELEAANTLGMSAER
ncbi:MAG: hypothetical protein NUW01_02720, partial [Gemmatimonadaceae bacterium]|nr:hypothetical protein [Gemmatimonadaceae bacterium]